MASNWCPGKEITFQALGKTYKLSRVTYSVWEDLEKYLREHLANPVDAVLPHVEPLINIDNRVMKRLAEEDAMAVKFDQGARTYSQDYQPLNEVLSKLAIQALGSQVHFGSPEMMALLSWPHHLTKVLQFLLKKYQPEVGMDEAEEIANEVGYAAISDWFLLATGRVPQEEKKSEGGDPGHATPPGF